MTDFGGLLILAGLAVAVLALVLAKFVDSTEEVMRSLFSVALVLELAGIAAKVMALFM